MVLYGIRLIINIFDLFIYQRYLETFIGKRKTSVEFSVFLLIVCEVIGSAVNQLGINWLNLATLVVILGIYICQYRAKIVSKIAAIILYMGLVAVTEPIGYVAYRLFMEKYVHEETMVYYVTAIFVELFRAVLVAVFCRLKSGKSIKVSLLPREVLYALITIPLTSLVCCYLIIEVSIELISEQLMAVCMCIILLIFAMNYIVFYMINKYTVMQESRHEEELLMKEIAYNQEYYEDVERYQEQIHDIKHDMKNRLLVLYGAAECGRNDYIKQKLSEMLGDIQLAEDIIYSANPVLNSILKVNALKAKEMGIEFKVRTFIPRKISIDSGDMGVLYGNLLDNALEACGRVQEEKRRIDFETKYQEEKLLIMIENSKPMEENPELKTSKANKRLHGRGIRAVRRLAEKYGGNLVLEDKGDIFQVRLLLTNVECLE